MNQPAIMTDQIVMRAADNIRILSAAMVEKAKSGHPGGAMGGADFITILFSEYLQFDPGDFEWPFRDRFFLDPGHMSPMLYSTLSMYGAYSAEDLKSFRQWGSCTPGHPEIDIARGIENTSGPLGQGHAMAVGAAIAERFIAARFGEWTEHKIYTFISDGGIQEEISQGAGRIAGYFGLSNLIMFYDSNDIQLSTETNQVTSEDTALKYEAWGWNVITIKGNDHEAIRSALDMANTEKEKPTLIIGKTIMGKGAVGENGENYEYQVATHGQPLTKAGASIDRTIKNLGGDPDSPFAVFPEVKDFYKEVCKRKKEEVKARKEVQKNWEAGEPELAQKLHDFLSGKLPELDLSEVQFKPDSPTRSTSGAVLKYLAGKIENMIVMSADLSNSDKTEGFIKGGKKPLAKGDFTGGFVHAGVSELTMAAMANGIAVHSGIFVACGTFFVFSDFMKPAIRLAALMELPVIYIWTHDAFRVGEDGPTHQPIEHEAQIRLLEKVKNHSGNNSMLVLRPADAYETLVAWEMALRNSKTPTGLIFSRQAVDDLPGTNGKTRMEMATEARKGAYSVLRSKNKPDVILLGNGSEVSLLLDAAKKLVREKNIEVQVVSVISEGLFRNRDKTYQEEVIPPGVPVFGLTAGLSTSLQGLVGPNSYIYGVDHFGYSAPAHILDEKFGFCTGNIYNEICHFLKI